MQNTPKEQPSVAAVLLINGDTRPWREFELFPPSPFEPHSPSSEAFPLLSLQKRI